MEKVREREVRTFSALSRKLMADGSRAKSTSLSQVKEGSGYMATSRAAVLGRRPRADSQPLVLRMCHDVLS